MRWRVGRVEVDEEDANGTSIVPLGGAAGMAARLQLHPGDWFSGSLAARSLQEIERVYRDAGYARAEVTPEIDTHQDRGAADLRVRIARGPLVTIARVDVEGAAPAARDAILARIHPRAGEHYSETALDASSQAVRDAGLARHVDVAIEAVPDRVDQLVLHVEVRP
jgi:outer membrane protein insertion porin family